MTRFARRRAPTEGQEGAGSQAQTLAENAIPLRLHDALAAHRRLVVAATYGGVAVLSLAAAFWLRFEMRWPAEYTTTFLAAAPLLVAIRLAFAAIFRLSAGRWRFVGTGDVIRLVGATSLGTVAFFAAGAALAFSPPLPRSVVFIEWVLTTYVTAGIWISYRTAYERLRQRRMAHGRAPTPVLIVGAGEAGNLLVREILRFPTGYRAVGIIDDDAAKLGTSLQGVVVRGRTDQIAEVAHETAAEELIIAVPSATPAELRRIVKACEATDLPFKVLPGIAEVLAGDIRLTQVRELRIEDLLGREPVDLDLPELSSAIAGTCVLITGAAGSIGSELARQIAHHRPARLVLVDRAETDLYYLELDLRRKHPGLALHPVVCDVSQAPALDRVFAEHHPRAVFHAAAYKHVPMMETNVRSAIWNNVYGTLAVGEAAAHYGAAQCVLVSTDKAVRPSSIMGATKRLAEMVVVELQARHPGTTFTAVRFGNVLGSSGSVIPIFQRQIARGEPLTVTHPEATRYFMTIPEAVQLILQASLLPDMRGRIAMLDMGEPIRIVELAENLLRLSPQRRRSGPGIVFVGLRPGEKLHEELVAPEEQTIQTPIPKIRVIAHGQAKLRVLPFLDGWKQEVVRAPEALLLSRLSTIFPSLADSDLPLKLPAAAGNGRKPARQSLIARAAE